MDNFYISKIIYTKNILEFPLLYIYKLIYTFDNGLIAFAFNKGKCPYLFRTYIEGN